MSSGKISFCFISETSRSDCPILDPSVRYRCFNIAEALVEKGHYCAVYSSKQFREAFSPDFDVYIFHRPSLTNPKFEFIFNKLTSLNKTLIADYDDLIFGSTDTAMQSSIVKNNVAPIKDVINIFTKNTEALQFFTKFTVSTFPLKIKILEQVSHANVEVIHNTIPRSVFDVCALYQPHKNKNRHFTVGYFSGTRSHNVDFKEVEEVLYKFINENDNASLFIVGQLEVQPGLAAHPRVYGNSAVAYMRLPALMKQCNTVIAPLEKTVFNNCKSRVKFLEAALTGCKLIASPIDDMLQIKSGAIQFCDDFEGWYTALTSPQDYDEDRAEKAFDYLRSECHAAVAANKLLNFLG